MFFGEQERDGQVFVCANSAQGNRGVYGAYDALKSDVASDGSVRKALLMECVQAVTGEAPLPEETIFGRVAVRRYVAARLAALTQHPFSDQGVNKILRGWNFVERTAGLDWSCVRSLDTAVGSHLAARVKQWNKNLTVANTGRYQT